VFFGAEYLRRKAIFWLSIHVNGLIYLLLIRQELFRSQEPNKIHQARILKVILAVDI